LALSAVCLGWGTIPLLAAEVDLPAPAIVFARVWIAAGGLAVVLAATRSAGPRLMSIEPGRCVAVGVLLAAHWTAMFAAYDRAPDSTVIFLIFLAPIGIALIERPARRLVAALAVAVVGFALIAGPTFRGVTDRELAGLGYAVVASATFVVLVLLAKPLAEAYGGLRLTLLEMVVAGVALVPAAITSEWSDTTADLGWLAVLGLGHTAFGTAVYLRTLGLLPATEVGILGYLEPVGVVVFAWLLAGSAPTLLTVAGGAVVIAGGALAITTPSEVSLSVPR
jgi:drug/metabolite transporter (DMT)-like permease